MDLPAARDAERPAPPPGWPKRMAVGTRRAFSRIAPLFRDQDPTLRAALLPALLVSAVLFVRSPLSNYIFDEQEALLANPFVNGKVPWRDVLTRDFWGLPHDRSIGSYRPLPNLIWRSFWQLGRVMQHPWALHWINVVLHAVNAALVARITFGLTRRRDVGWLAGAGFVTSAVLTEAVTGVVGIADVLGGLSLLVAVLALERPLLSMGPAVALALTLGFFSKESTLVALPIVSWVALTAAPLHHPKRPLRLLRALVALLAAAMALALYTETRRRFFPSPLPAELADPLPASKPWLERAFHEFLRWFHQPRLPQDPINNPLVRADTPHRISGALGVYASGLGQVLFPWTLSGDYSLSAEPIPARLYNARSVLGAALLVVPPVAGVLAWLGALGIERRGRLREHSHWVVLAIALVWVPVAYFPHSNIPVLLPTVRAERFWYVPVAGAALALGLGLARLLGSRAVGAVPAPEPWNAPMGRPARRRIAAGALLVSAFLGFQMLRARIHAFDYTNDLVFWRSTARAVPMSAKAHLNYGVMLGARGKLEERLVENRRAKELAPEWPMAHVYYADTLCRLTRTDEAWPHYEKGMTLGPNDRNLIALALQCLWDRGGITSRRDHIARLADAHPGSWLAFLGHDILKNGEKNAGVDREYRPRGYDEGPGD